MAIDVVREAAGYAHPDYVRSLEEFGRPLRLRRSGGWLLERAISGTDVFDGMGSYPLFSCVQWDGLAADLEDLRDQLVAVSAVIDPFAPLDAAELNTSFDRVKPFKQHYVIDFRGVPLHASKHHRYYAKRALRDVAVHVVESPEGFAKTWASLYGTLTERHGITGMRAFSLESFARQLSVPGLVAFGAHHEGRVVAAHLWYLVNDVAYSHLAASSEDGYRLMASYALYQSAIEFFSGRVRYMDLGAGAGSEAGTGGLTRFKQGWSNDTRTVYFCGRVLNPRRYEQLVTERAAQATNYFPAYRVGEFG